MGSLPFPNLRFNQISDLFGCLFCVKSPGKSYSGYNTMALGFEFSSTLLLGFALGRITLSTIWQCFLYLVKLISASESFGLLVENSNSHV